MSLSARILAALQNGSPFVDAHVRLNRATLHGDVVHAAVNIGDRFLCVVGAEMQQDEVDRLLTKHLSTAIAEERRLRDQAQRRLDRITATLATLTP